MAVYPAGAGGACRRWVAESPSDQDRNRYVFPARCWRAGALTVLAEPTITVFENGVVSPPDPASSVRPGGLEVNARETVRGRSATLAIPGMPSALTAESWSSRYEGYSWSGAENVPLETPGKLWTTCV
jgi:hypothetical protein